MYQLGICDEAEADMYYMILLIVWFSIMPSIAFKRNALRQIKELGSNLPRYPKRYIAPANWMRKWFKITKGKLIPRFLYFELILSVAYAVLGPIFIAIYMISGFNLEVGGALLWVLIPICFMCMIYLNHRPCRSPCWSHYWRGSRS